MKGVVESLPIVASMLAEQTGVKLTISGYTAFTDGSLINLPLLPASGDKVATLAYGYLCHEAAHIRYTDMDSMADIPTPIGKRLLNILEDARIEHRLMRDFPGARFRLEGLSKEIDGDVHSAEEHRQGGAARLLCNHLLNHMNVTALGRQWVELDREQSRAAFESTFGEATLIKLEAITAGVHLKPSTFDLFPVVNCLLQALKDAQEEAEQKVEQNQHNQPNQPDPQPSQQQGQGDGGEDDDVTEDAAADGSPDTADQNTGQELDNATQDSQSGADEPDYQAIAQALAQVLEAGDEDLADDRQNTVKSALEQLAGSTGQPSIGMMQCIPADTTGGTDFQSSQEVSDSTRALRNRIRALLQSEVKTRHRYADQGSRLAGSRLARLESGKTDVFRHTVKRKGVDTAISLLVDQSGSMSDPAGNGQWLYQVACEAAYAIADSVEGIKGVTMAVNAFPYESQHGYDTAEIKAFGEPLRKAIKAFGTIRPQGCTPLAEAMMAVGNRLYRRGEHRKILILATDGDPDDGEATHEAIRQLSNLGIELVAIGINTGAVRTYFNDHLVIRNVQDLPQELFGVLKRLLFSNQR